MAGLLAALIGAAVTGLSGFAWLVYTIASLKAQAKSLRDETKWQSAAIAKGLRRAGSLPPPRKRLDTLTEYEDVQWDEMVRDAHTIPSPPPDRNE
jgi:hypothetical protein